MRDHTGHKRCYTRTSKTWYAKSLENENVDVVITMENVDGGGVSGELIIEWIPLDDKLSPRLKCLDDSWSALMQFKDLLGRMAEVDGQDISEDDFCKILDELGIIEITPYEKGVPKNDIYS